MKKIIGLSFIAVLLTFQSCGTTSNMQEFYTKYDNQSTVIPLPSFALKLAGKAGGTDLFNYLKSAKVFVVSDAVPLIKNVTNTTTTTTTTGTTTATTATT